MAYPSFTICAPPGTATGPCERACNHAMCAVLRMIAREHCPVCGRAIGYDTEFRPLWKRGNRHFAHEHCAWLLAQEAEVIKAARSPGGRLFRVDSQTDERTLRHIAEMISSQIDRIVNDQERQAFFRPQCRPPTPNKPEPPEGPVFSD